MGAVGEPAFALPRVEFPGQVDSERADQQPNSRFPRHLAQGGQHGMVRLVARFFTTQFANRLREPGVLGRHDKIRAVVACAPHEIGDDTDVGLVIARRGELYTRGSESVAHLALPSLLSSSPARSSATSSSEPPICSPLMKICGTDVRPPARRIISSRRAGSSMISISI